MLLHLIAFEVDEYYDVEKGERYTGEYFCSKNEVTVIRIFSQDILLLAECQIYIEVVLHEGKGHYASRRVILRRHFRYFLLMIKVMEK